MDYHRESIGGEARQLQGGAPEEREFVHTSLSFVGKAYAQLRAAGVPRSRIITIVQLQDTLRVLHMGVTGEIQTGIPPAYYQEQKANTEAACRRMIDEGGADYDYDAVNPETVWNVLTGGEGARAGKVIPAEDSDSPIFFAIYSHGDSHSAHPSSAQEAKEPHTAKVSLVASVMLHAVMLHASRLRSHPFSLLLLIAFAFAFVCMCPLLPSPLSPSP